ncbi:MAG: methyltransferase domain-containing protein, partial [Proteobacteria bacterium]
MELTQQQEALISIGDYLKANHYLFTTVTPESHRRVLERPYDPEALRSEHDSLRACFGWNQWVCADRLPPSFESFFTDETLFQVEEKNSKRLVKAKFRFSTLQLEHSNLIFVHSGYPTHEGNSVFFGPDSYRFANFVREKVKHGDQKFPLRILDLGCGSGVGAISLAAFLNRTPERFIERAPKFIFTDLNEKALEYACVNVRLNEQALTLDQCEFVKSNLFDEIKESADLVIANPPFIIDDKKRAYRHGGDHFGCSLSATMFSKSVDYLGRDGRVLMYTGTSIVNGE